MLKRVWLSGLAFVVIASCATNEASHAQGGTAYCLDFSQPSQPAAEVAAACTREATQNPGLTGVQSAIAGYHAAAAQLALNDPEAAALRITESFARLENGHEQLRNPPRDVRGRRKQDAWRQQSAAFQYERVMVLARAYQALAGRSSSACRDKADCLTIALNRMGAASTLAALAPYQPAGQPRDVRVDNFHLLRADLFAARGQGVDPASAISDYENVLQNAAQGSPVVLTARSRLVGLANTLGEAALAGASEQDKYRAIDYFEKSLAQQPGQIRALSGKALAYRRLAGMGAASGVDRRGDFAAAAQAYSDAAATAGADNAARAKAHYDLGQTRLEWAAMLAQTQAPADQAQAQALRRQAVGAFEEAIRIAPDTVAYRDALGAAYAGTGDFLEAARTYMQAMSLMLQQPAWLPPAEGNTAGAAEFRAALSALAPADRQTVAPRLMSWADAVERGGHTETGRVMDLLAAAEIADGGSAEASLRLGKLYLAAGRRTDAVRKLESVLSSTNAGDGTARPGMNAVRAEALYLLSRSEITGSSRQMSERGLNRAKEAASLQGSNRTYAGHACLAHILAERKFVTASGIDIWCAGINGAEGYLLKGMLDLRRAREDAAARRYLNDAAQAKFSEGRRDLAQMPENAPQPRLDWAVNPDGAPSLNALLQYGIAIAVTCNGARSEVALPAADAQRANAFFSDHRVGPCS